MRVLLLRALAMGLVCVPLAACHKAEEARHEEKRAIVVTSPKLTDIVRTEEYVCQIHSRKHIEICALVGGYLEVIPVKEGQAVQQGDRLFKILPTLYQARLDSEAAEVELAQIELSNTERLFKQGVVSDKEVALAKAKLAKVSANRERAQAQLNFTDVKAPFDGIVDRLLEQQGSLIEEKDILTTLSDNSVMWVYFNVPEARYLEYQTGTNSGSRKEDLQVELVLANGEKFDQPGAIGAIEADFNNRTGNVAFRADFSNPEALLRHGQTGKILLHRIKPNALVIPQRATYETLDKRYAYVVGEDGVVHQRDIVVESEQDDIFLIKEGLEPNDKIVLEGILQVRDGEHVEFEYRAPEEVLGHLKYAAE